MTSFFESFLCKKPNHKIVPVTTQSINNLDNYHIIESILDKKDKLKNLDPNNQELIDLN